jgi:hypothetical protein
MVKALIVFVGILVAGCTTFGIKVFDPVEYNYPVLSGVESSRAIHLCGNIEHIDQFNGYVRNLNLIGMEMFEYENFHSENHNSLLVIQHLRDLELAFIGHSKYSAQYCIHKLSEIQSVSRTLAKAFGGQGGLNICLSDITARYALYETSYKEGKISKDEFLELVGDIKKIGDVDMLICSLQEKQQISKSIDKITKAVAFLTSL